MSRKLTTEEFIQRANSIHKNKYNYSKVVYTKGKDKVCIICPEHGEFWQEATSHLMGCGCPKCKDVKLHRDRAFSTEQFISKARQVHENKYDYSKVKYINTRVPVIITCPIHGDFKQIPENHLKGCGCSRCNRFCQVSKGEKFVEEYLVKHNIKYIRQYSVSIPKQINKSGYAQCDFYLPDYNTIIEYNGEQHYKYSPHFHTGGIIDFNRQKERDKYIRTYCIENNINLIEISYKLSLDKVEKLLADRLAVTASQRV